MTNRSLHLQKRDLTSLVVTAAGLWLLTAGCAPVANTPAQDLAWSRWTVCRTQATGTEIRTVRLDGRISFWYEGSANRLAMLDCLRLAANAGPVLPEPTSEPLECAGGGGGM